MFAKIVAAAFFCFSGYAVFSQKISYQVSFPNIEHHEAKIEVTVTGAGQEDLNLPDEQIFSRTLCYA